jgi:hypothetical protein
VFRDLLLFIERERERELMIHFGNLDVFLFSLKLFNQLSVMCINEFKMETFIYKNENNIKTYKRISRKKYVNKKFS